jgi:hypothetical protein
MADMGVYLVPFDLSSFDEEGENQPLIEAALSKAGLPSLASVDGHGDGFEEKFIADFESFERLYSSQVPSLQLPLLPTPTGGAPHPCPGASADLWLPFAFSGLIKVTGVPGIYNEELTIGSSVEIANACRALGDSVEFPFASVPLLNPDGYVLNEWHESLTASADPGDPIWKRDPDIAFYLALFLAAGTYSLTHNQAVSYT